MESSSIRSHQFLLQYFQLHLLENVLLRHLKCHILNSELKGVHHPIGELPTHIAKQYALYHSKILPFHKLRVGTLPR